MPLKYTPDKIIQNRNYAVTDSAPKANQKMKFNGMYLHHAIQ